jgi:hypothetical protein
MSSRLTIWEFLESAATVEERRRRVRPSWIWSPMTISFSSTCSPFTKTPLELPRSIICQWFPLRRSSAWRREIWASFRRNMQFWPRPIVTGSSMISKRVPISFPRITKRKSKSTLRSACQLIVFSHVSIVFFFESELGADRGSLEPKFRIVRFQLDGPGIIVVGFLPLAPRFETAGPELKPAEVMGVFDRCFVEIGHCGIPITEFNQNFSPCGQKHGVIAVEFHAVIQVFARFVRSVQLSVNRASVIVDQGGCRVPFAAPCRNRPAPLRSPPDSKEQTPGC